MEPKLKTSRKWTPFPEELLTQLRSVFKQNFRDQIGTGTVEVTGRIYPDEILVSTGFRVGKGLKQSNFVVSIAYKRNKDNVMKLIHTGVDALAALFEQFFAAADDSEFPRVWEEVNFEGRTIYVQYDTTNTELESEADKILGAAGGLNEVAQGEWDDDEDLDPDLIKAQLGIDPDDEGGGETH